MYSSVYIDMNYRNKITTPQDAYTWELVDYVLQDIYI